MTETSEKSASRTRWRAVTLQYDFYETLDKVDTCPVCLTEWEQWFISGILKPFMFPTRWYTVDELPIDHDELKALITGLDAKLGLAVSSCDICQLMADCLNAINNQDYDDLTDGQKSLYDELQNWNQNNGGSSGGNYEQPQGYNEPLTLLDEGAGCDKDNLFGAVTGLVDFVHKAIMDFLEALEGSQTSMELIAECIGLIPILGATPADDILDFVDTFISNLQDNYEAAYTQLLRDDYRCELFCLAVKQDCELTFVDMVDYFGERAGDEILQVDFLDIIEYFTGGIFSGDELVHAAHWLFCSVLAYNSSWLGISKPRLLQIVQALWNDPDSDWAILCDCGWFRTINTNDDLIDYTIVYGNAQPTRIISVEVPPNVRLQVYTDFPGPATLDTVTVTGRFDEVANVRDLRVQAYNGAVKVFEEYRNLPGHPGPEYFDYEFDIGGLTATRVNVTWLVSNGTDTGFAGMTKYFLEGSGADPWP